MHTAAQRAKAEIRKSLDELPYATRQLMGLVAFVPVIPDSQQVVNEWIEAFAKRIVSRTDDAYEADREYILRRLEKLGVNVSSDTPPSVLRLAAINMCKAVSAQFLLEAGIFGRPCSAKQAQEARKEMVEAYLPRYVTKGWQNELKEQYAGDIYEEYGHLSDAMKYLVSEVVKNMV